MGMKRNRPKKRMLRKKKRRLIKLLSFPLLLMLSILTATNKPEDSPGLKQEEIVWNTVQELELLSGVENRIELAAQGRGTSIPVVTPASKYEDICPDMEAAQSGTDGSTNSNPEEKTVYLTFDDGPSRNTLEILEILNSYQIRATFFVVSGNMTQSGEEGIKLAAEQGHVIGMHADSHDYSAMYSSVENFLTDYGKVFSMIQDTTGITPTLYRFPGGSYNTVGRRCILEIIPEMERRGFIYFDWNVTAEDAVGTPTASSIKNNIFKNLDQTEQPVILMHDGAINSLTVKVLPDIIEELIRREYRFDTLDHREQCRFNW